MSTDLAQAKRTLLGLLGARWPDGGVAAAQWPLIGALAVEHRLEPLLAWQADRGAWDAPDAVARAWQAARRAAALTVLTQQAALRLALERLAAAGIRAVALKGVALAWRHYPEPGLRPMRDIDLLVPEAQVCEAAAILAEAGFAPDAADAASIAAALADGHQMPAQTHPELGVTIELHHHLTDPPQRRGYRVPQLSPETALARAEIVDCGGRAVACPTPQDLATHLIVHALYGHRLDCGPLVLADLHFLAATAEIDWQRLRGDAEAQGWLRGADLLLALTARWFGSMPAAFAPPPAPVLAAAEQALLPDPAARDHAEAMADLAAARSPAALVRALARRLVPDSEIVATEGGGGSAWAFWPRWAARRTARLARRLADRRISEEGRAAARVIRWVQG